MTGTIRPQNTVSENWQIAMTDGEVSVIEREQIFQAALADGVSPEERSDARELIQVASRLLEKANHAEEAARAAYKEARDAATDAQRRYGDANTWANQAEDLVSTVFGNGDSSLQEVRESYRQVQSRSIAAANAKSSAIAATTTARVNKLMASELEKSLRDAARQ